MRFRLPALVLVILAWFIPPESCTGQESVRSTINSREYLSHIRALKERFEGFSAEGEEPEAELSEILRQADETITGIQVRMEGGTLVPVDNEWLSDLAEDLEDLEDPEETEDMASGAVRNLEALEDSLNRYPMLGSPPGARDALDDILATEEFRDRTESSSDLWLRDLIRWAQEKAIEPLMDWMDRFMDRFRGFMSRWVSGSEDTDWEAPAGLAGVLKVLAIASLLAVVMVPLYWLIRRFMRRTRRYREEDEIIELPDRSVLESQAREFAGRSRWRGAIRFSYLGLLAELQKRNLLRYDRTKTNWEYAQELGSFHGIESFRGLTRIFDSVWYGMREPSREDYEGFHSEVTRMTDGRRH